VLGGSEFFLGGFKREIVTRFEFIDTALVDVKANDGAFAAEFNGKGKTDITETDD
jgi:hypothetical protein